MAVKTARSQHARGKTARLEMFWVQDVARPRCYGANYKTPNGRISYVLERMRFHEESEEKKSETETEIETETELKLEN